MSSSKTLLDWFPRKRPRVESEVTACASSAVNHATVINSTPTAEAAPVTTTSTSPPTSHTQIGSVPVENPSSATPDSTFAKFQPQSECPSEDLSEMVKQEACGDGLNSLSAPNAGDSKANEPVDGPGRHHRSNDGDVQTGDRSREECERRWASGQRGGRRRRVDGDRKQAGDHGARGGSSGASSWTKPTINSNTDRRPKLPLPIDDDDRWQVITGAISSAASQPYLHGVGQFEAILKACRHQNSVDVSGLRAAAKNDQDFSKEFCRVVPIICRHALKLKERMDGVVIHLLPSGARGTVTLVQDVAVSLLAHSFLCTLPPQQSADAGGDYPSATCERLFSLSHDVVTEKIKFLLNYFSMYDDESRSSTVFIRRVHLDGGVLDREDGEICDVEIESKGTIETTPPSAAQVDFANKFIGGGVLGRGAVQEEIRFMLSPETLVSRMVCGKLRAYEAVIISGTERFSAYSGYAQTFRFEGPFQDETPLIPTEDGRVSRACSILAIDAVNFNRFSGGKVQQYDRTNTDREISKALCGFVNVEECTVATGNWGCGAFGGDPLWKFLVQLVAASVAKKKLLYFTFGDETLEWSLKQLYSVVVRNKMTPHTLYKFLTSCEFTPAAKDNGPAPLIKLIQEHAPCTEKP